MLQRNDRSKKCAQPPAPPLEAISRTLLGPGPSDVPPSVLRAMSLPTIGHLDPKFLDAMDHVRCMLRAVFGTKNQLTIPMSGTGSAGLEACMVNLIEPGDAVLVGVNGVFGTRMAEVARRCGAAVTTAQVPWGRAFDMDDLRSAAAGQRYKLLCVVHAETSTGALQDLRQLRELADELGALLLIDAVTSFAGLRLEIDALGIDAVYAGTQKCLSCPPGLAPVSFSPRAEETLALRRTPVTSWYLDLSLIRQYWGCERAYHHTAPINMTFAIHEALRLVLEEGIESRAARHEQHSRALWAGLEAMGLTLTVPMDQRLPTLTTVDIPDGVDDAAVRRMLLDDYSLEIGGGLGPMKGKVWRIGLMGHGCSRQNVTLCLAALTGVLRQAGYAPTGDPLAAADATYHEAVAHT